MIHVLKKDKCIICKKSASERYDAAMKLSITTPIDNTRTIWSYNLWVHEDCFGDQLDFEILFKHGARWTGSLSNILQIEETVWEKIAGKKYCLSPVYRTYDEEYQKEAYYLKSQRISEEAYEAFLKESEETIQKAWEGMYVKRRASEWGGSIY